MAFRFSIILACSVWSNAAFAQLDATTILDEPVKVSTSAERDIFPKSWQTTRVNAHADPLADGEIERSKTITARAFKKYPARVLKSNVDAVYVVQRLGYFGITASGTNSNDTIYLANRGSKNGFTEDWIERVFHSELSSILLRNFPQYLDEDAWKAINEPSFKYGATGVRAIQTGKAKTVYDANLQKKGFLYEYAQSTLENDFNSIAENLFVKCGKFRLLESEHDRIRKKTKLVMEFYQKIDRSFDSEFFELITNSSKAK